MFCMFFLVKATTFRPLAFPWVVPVINMAETAKSANKYFLVPEAWYYMPRGLKARGHPLYRDVRLKAQLVDTGKRSSLKIQGQALKTALKNNEYIKTYKT